MDSSSKWLPTSGQKHANVEESPRGVELEMSEKEQEHEGSCGRLLSSLKGVGG